MKNITTILFAGTATVLLTACGGSGSSNSESSPPAASGIPVPSLGNNRNYTVDIGEGTGVSNDPYQVGSGMYPVRTSSTEYFTFDVTRDSCNIALIDGMNITSLKVYDSAWNIMASKGSRAEIVLYSLNAGIYNVSASSWHSGSPSLGIYSDCITEYSNKYISNMENGPQTFYFIKDIYKFNMANDGQATIDDIDGLDYVTLYDAAWNRITIIDNASMPEGIDLFAGNYFLVPTQYVFGYRDDSTSFMFRKN